MLHPWAMLPWRNWLVHCMGTMGPNVLVSESYHIRTIEQTQVMLGALGPTRHAA